MAIRLSNHDADEIGEMSEINVTPFIDVILVLLIIFMVAAPLSTVSVPVNLPTASAQAAPTPSAHPLFLTVKSDLTLLLGEEVVSQQALPAKLEARTGNDHAQRVFLQADKTVPYGELMRVMNLLRSAGYLKIALVGLEGADERAQSAPAP